MEDEKKIIYDLMDLGMDPANVTVEFDKSISEIRKLRELDVVINWRGKKNQTVGIVNGEMSEKASDLIINISNGNVIVFSTNNGMTDNLLTIYKNKEIHHIYSEDRFKAPNDSDVINVIITNEVKESLTKVGNILSGILSAYESKFNFK